MRITNLNELIEHGKKLRGAWRLGKTGEIEYRGAGAEERVLVRATPIAAGPHSLTASVTAVQSGQNLTSKQIHLSGSWRTDPHNRLSFEVERETGPHDVLAFGGAWELNDANEIVYRTRRRRLKTRARRDDQLVLRGHWELRAPHRLAYMLSNGDGRGLEFRGAFQTRSILAKRGEIRYQIGAGARSKTVVLFGKWKYSDRFGLSFEAEDSGPKRSIEFGMDLRLNGRDTIAAALKSRTGEKLGVEVLFRRDLTGRDGSAFMKLRKSLEDSRVEAGATFRF